MQPTNQIFNRQRLRHHRDRAAANFPAHDFLIRESAERLAERLEDITRSFPLALDLGAHSGTLASVLGSRGNIKALIQTDLSAALIKQAPGLRLACDEEFLPFAEGIFDLVLSNWSLHWVNDLVGSLIQIKNALKPDGLFLCCLPGAHTLRELRESALAVGAENNFLTPLVAPFVEVRDAGALLQRADFALPVVDSETITVIYENAFKLFEDLRGMGEANALMEQHSYFSRRSHFTAIADHYQRTFADSEGRIPATFELITMTGWKPDASQPQPLKRGSGKESLKNILQ